MNKSADLTPLQVDTRLYDEIIVFFADLNVRSNGAFDEEVFTREVLERLLNEIKFLKDCIVSNNRRMKSISILTSFVNSYDFEEFPPEFLDLLLPYIEEIILQLIGQIIASDDSSSIDIVNLFSFYAGFEVHELIISKLRMYKEKMTWIALQLLNTKEYTTFVKLMAITSNEIEGEVTQILDSLVKSDANFLENIFPYLIICSSSALLQFANQQTKIYAERYDIEESELSRILSLENSSIHNMLKYINTVLNQLSDLHTLSPNSIPYLRNEYGITNWGRYPTSLLARIYNERDQPGSFSNIMLIQSRDDYNGASIQSAPVIENLAQDLKSLGYRIVVFECGNLSELTSRFITSCSRFGIPEGVVIRAHGTIDQIALSPEENGTVNFEDIMRSKGMRAISLLHKGNKPSFVFCSCSAGQETGIAQKISNQFGVDITAPMGDSSTESITPRVDASGNLILDAFYSVESTHYSKGNRVVV